jgi:DNA-binding NtrC family response regulator
MGNPKADKKRERILVLDLDDWCQQFLSSVLKMLDIDFTLATSVDQAREALEKDPFDLLITDLQIPECLRFLDNCRHRDPTMHFIFMVHRQEASYQLVYQERTDIVLKPLNMDEIIRKIRNAIRQKQRRQMEEELRRLKQAAFRILE